jgi:hypothetical protein
MERSMIVIKPSDEIARTVGHIVKRWQATDTALLRLLFPILADGRPVSLRRLAEAAGTDEATVEAALRLGHVDRDSQGRAVELFGLGLRSTRHRVLLGDVALYSCCAVVALTAPALLGRTVSVESVDPVANRVVRLVASPYGLERVEPQGAVGCLAVTREDDVLSNVREAFCSHVSVFPSPEAAGEFLEADPRRYAVSIADFHAAAVQLAAAVWKQPARAARGPLHAALLTPRLTM